MHTFLPAVALSEVTGAYGIMDTPRAPAPMTVHQLLAFNLGGAQITGDADGFDGPLAACAMTEGGRILGKGEGRMVFVYLLAGTLNRLFGLDPTTLVQPRPIERGESPVLDRLLAALMACRDSRQAIVETIDAHFLEAKQAAEPMGLPDVAHRYLVRDATGNIPAIADRLGVSLRTLERRFKARYGCSPARYLRHLRLVRATPSNFQDFRWDAVPPEVEYYDQSHWLRDLKAIYGATPSELNRMPLAAFLHYPDGCYDPAQARDKWDEHEVGLRRDAWRESGDALVAAFERERQ